MKPSVGILALLIGCNQPINTGSSKPPGPTSQPGSLPPCPAQDPVGCVDEINRDHICSNDPGELCKTRIRETSRWISDESCTLLEYDVPQQDDRGRPSHFTYIVAKQTATVSKLIDDHAGDWDTVTLTHYINPNGTQSHSTLERNGVWVGSGAKGGGNINKRAELSSVLSYGVFAENEDMAFENIVHQQKCTSVGRKIFLGITDVGDLSCNTCRFAEYGLLIIGGGMLALASPITIGVAVGIGSFGVAGINVDMFCAKICAMENCEDMLTSCVDGVNDEWCQWVQVRGTTTGGTPAERCLEGLDDCVKGYKWCLRTAGVQVW